MTKEDILKLDSKKHVKIWLLYKLGMSRKDIASALGTNPGHVGNEIKAYEKNEDKRKAAASLQNSDIKSNKQNTNENKEKNTIEETISYLSRGFETAKEKYSVGELKDKTLQLTYDFAKQKNKWFSGAESLPPPAPGGGNENSLYYNEKTGEIYKSNNLFNHQFNILSYLKYLLLHNELFKSAKYRLVGFTGLDNGYDKNKNSVPYIEPVVAQKYFLGKHADVSEIENHMTSLGFEKISDDTYKKGMYIVSDLKPRNVIKAKDGEIYVIDNIITEEKSKQTIIKKESESDLYKTIRKEAIASEKENPEVDEDGLCAGMCAVISGDLKDRLYKNHKIESEWIDVGNSNLKSIYESDHSALLIADKGLIVDTQVWQFTDHDGPKEPLTKRKIVFTLEEYSDLGFYWGVVKMGDGGVLVGKKHGSGGIKAVIEGTSPIELQSGEVIINAKAAKEHCEELSEINQSAGNGVAFDCNNKAIDGIQGPMSGKGTRIAEGIEVEKEHEDLYEELSNRLEAEGHKMPMTKHEFFRMIAIAHIKERPDYYELLKNYVEAENIPEKPWFKYSKEEIIKTRDRIEMNEAMGRESCCCDKQLIKDLARHTYVTHKQLLKNLK